MLMYKASYHIVVLFMLSSINPNIQTASFSTVFFLHVYPTDCGQTTYCFKPTYPSAC